MERVAFKEVYDFLSQNNPNHLGYSTEAALLSVTESLKGAGAAGQSPILILLDFSAASDSVNQLILLSTL